MDEFELDTESVFRAEKLSSSMMHDLRMIWEQELHFEERRRLFFDKRYSEETQGVPISDVVSNLGRLGAEFTLARRWDAKVLCLKLPDGEIAPISLTNFRGGPLSMSYDSEAWYWESLDFPSPSSHHQWREFVRRAAQQDERLTAIGLREAEEAVGRGLNRFLAYRFAGMKQWTEGSFLSYQSRLAEWIRRLLGGGHGLPPGNLGPQPPASGAGPGLLIQVSCQTPGLRIHVAPVFFINWVFFGSPTTPVTSYILPGRYVFAGDGPMLPTLTQDSGVFSIPPTFHAILTRF